MYIDNSNENALVPTQTSDVRLLDLVASLRDITGQIVAVATCPDIPPVGAAYVTLAGVHDAVADEILKHLRGTIH